MFSTPCLRTLVLLLGSLWLAACGDQYHTLPFPTPAQHDLVVLIPPGPLTYVADEGGKVGGLEHDIVEAFAQDLGVAARFVVAPANEIPARLARGEAHFAAAWYSPEKGSPLPTTPPFMLSHDVIVQHEASLPIDDLSELENRSVHVLAGSRQAATLRAAQAGVPGLRIVEERYSDAFALLAAVADRRVEVAAVDSAHLAIALQFVPSLQATLEFDEEEPVAWLFGEHFNPELRVRADAFIQRIQRDGTLARIEDRYFGHVRRLKAADIAKFVEQMETALPRLRQHFVTAQRQSGLDWRLVAAVAYQESRWDANAVSPTGVRGIMMLTEETADRLGVSNRLDARESIVAGARYLDFLRQLLPAAVSEPDRTWLALAAYNIGPGHFNAARNLARQLKADPDSWYEMKRILPLLAQPKYYEKLKAGRARGGEAVILVENIRSYYDILSRHESAFQPPHGGPNAMMGMSASLAGAPGRSPGLKPGR